MQQQLNNLVKERAMLRQRQATGRQNSRTYVDCDSETELDTSDWEDRRTLQAGAEAQKDTKCKDSSLKACGARTLRTKKRRKGQRLLENAIVCSKRVGSVCLLKSLTLLRYGDIEHPLF